jgi:hypothetical protein
MSTLSDQLLAPERRPAFVSDACALLDTEVTHTSGMSGMAIRSAYKVLQSVRPEAVPQAVDELLPAFTAQLEGYHAQSLQTGRRLTDVIDDDPGAVADALLGVADARVARTSRTTVRKAYKKVRGVARRHVVAALPAAAELVEKHTAAVDVRPPATVPNSAEA